MDISPDKLWWEMPGPVRFRTEICNALEQNKNVLLVNASHIPWKEILQEDYCNRRMVRNYAAANIVGMDDSDIADSGEETGICLLKKFCSNPNIRNSFRPSAKNPIGQYLQKNKVLSKKILWIRNISPERMEQWRIFLNSFSTASLEDGLFVLEYSAAKLTANIKSLLTLDYDRMVRDYDIYSYCCQLVSMQASNISLFHGRYFAAILNYLCRNKVERVAALAQMDSFPFFVGKQQDLFQRMHDLDNSITEEDVKESLWMAQLTELFPLIEQMRLKIIEQYSDAIQCAWDRNPLLQKSQNGESLESIKDWEIGTLWYLVRIQEIQMPQPSERDKVDLLRRMRNMLAHRSLCQEDDIRKLLEITEHFTA